MKFRNIIELAFRIFLACVAVSGSLFAGWCLFLYAFVAEKTDTWLTILAQGLTLAVVVALPFLAIKLLLLPPKPKTDRSTDVI